MRQRSTVTMSMRELDRLKCIQAVIDGELRATVAAERLGMSTRQVRRLTARYRLEGPVGLISHQRNRPSNRRLKEALENQVARIPRETYTDFGPTLAMEKLAERHQIVLAKETVRRIQIAAGLWIPRKLRPPKIQQPRTRRACVGELIQIDGYEHRWFEDRALLPLALSANRRVGVQSTSASHHPEAPESPHVTHCAAAGSADNWCTCLRHYQLWLSRSSYSCIAPKFRRTDSSG